MKTEIGPTGTPQVPWRRSDWDGPCVESRPENADPGEWPEGAVERVTFRRADFQEFPCANRLPQTLHFGADGWPLLTPEQVKPKLDPRCQAELRRFPWVSRPEFWDADDWATSFGNVARLARLRAQFGIVRRVSRHLPDVPAHH